MLFLANICSKNKTLGPEYTSHVILDFPCKHTVKLRRNSLIYLHNWTNGYVFRPLCNPKETACKDNLTDGGLWWAYVLFHYSVDVNTCFPSLHEITFLVWSAFGLIWNSDHNIMVAVCRNVLNWFLQVFICFFIICWYWYVGDICDQSLSMTWKLLYCTLNIKATD